MRGRRLPFVLSRPEQGWSSLLLLLGMLVLLGVSVADSRPLEIEGVGPLSSSLPLIMLAAGLIGFLLARSSLGVVRAHFIGAVLAALVLLLVAGAALLGQSPLPTELDGIGLRIARVWMQLDADIAALIAEEITTSTVTVYLVLGALCWTTAQFGAFSVFRYDRGGPAVMAIGTILFLNVGLGSLQAQEELLPVVPVLALFAALALLLLMRLQLVQQRFAWARRHISDTQDVSRLFIRTGVVFVLIAVLSASSLTVWATVEAQEVDIDAIEEPLEDVIDQLESLLGWIGVPPPDQVPAALGNRTQLQTTWNPGEGDAFTAEVPDGSLYGNYWWGKAEDLYDPAARTWRATRTSMAEVAAGEQLRPAGGSYPGPWKVSVVQLDLGGAARANLFRPPDAFRIKNQDVEARVAVDGSYSDMEYAEVLDRDAQVSFTSYVRDYRPLSGSITGNELRATAANPLPEWARIYLSGGTDRTVIGPFTEARIAKVRAEADGETPYDLAVAVQRELRSLTYDADLGTLCDAYDGVFTECLLAEERGFCQQYATTMVMMLRNMGVPARFVTGYLQGEQQSADRWVVPQRALHNWVEVYFPGAGWVRFDPTPDLEGLGQIPTELEDGPPIGPEPTPSLGPEPTEDPLQSPEPIETFIPPTPEGPEGSTGAGSSAGIFISLGALAGILVAVVSGLLLYRLRRLPDGDDSLAYLGIVSLATRLGYGPHPSQTEYEYADTLSETIPGVRDDLYVVTDAQVQTSYSARELDDERRGLLRSAYARIRTALLRLSLRWRR